MGWPTHVRSAEVANLAVEPLTESAIARRTGLQRKVIQRILAAYISVRALTVRFGGGRGVAKYYDRGPTWAEIPRRNPTIGGMVPPFAQPSPPPPPEPADALIHAFRFKLRLFEDEMWLRDRTGAFEQTPSRTVRRWTVATWTGDYQTWSSCRVHGKDCFCQKSTTWYEFMETSGKWRLAFKRAAVEVRAAGRKSRAAARKWVGTIMLMPLPIRGGPESIERDRELAFAAALDLMRDIRENRRLNVDGIPEQITETEFAFDVEDDETFPPGKTPVAPGVWLDRSPEKAGIPGVAHVETKDRGIAKALSLTLPQIAAAPDLLEILQDIRGTLVRVEGRLDDIESRLGRLER